MSFTFQLQGEPELVRNIARLKASAQKRVPNKAATRAAAILRKHMRRSVRQIQELKADARRDYARATISKRLRPRRGMAAVLVGPENKVQTSGNNWGNLANIFEGGAAAHTIEARPGRLLTDGSEVFGRVVNHPGITGRESLRRGFEAGAPEASREALRVAWAELTKQLKAT